MKNTILASMIAMGLMMSSMVFAEDNKMNDTGKELQKPQNLSTQIIDSGKDANAGKVEKKTDEQPKEVFHFAGHAFAN